jgi:thymidylate synthase
MATRGRRRQWNEPWIVRTSLSFLQVKDIDDFNFDDFEIVGYAPQKAIKMQMAV